MEQPARPPQRPARLRVGYPSLPKITRSAHGVSTQGTVISCIWGFFGPAFRSPHGQLRRQADGAYTCAVSEPLRLGDDELTLEAIAAVARGGRHVQIGPG